MPFHLQLFHLPHYHIHHNRRHPTRRTDVESGRANITAPTNVRRMDDVIDDSNFQPPEVVKTYRLLPILSGIMISFAIMLSIPSFNDHWYIRTVDNVTTETQPNPLLLDLALAFSMACEVLAGVFLIIRFAERCVKQMTIASITFLTCHDLINIPVVTVFGILHRFDDGFTYGQSFWFTVCSTVISTATNITLIIDYATTKDFALSGSGLTSKQRALVIIVMVLLFYISFGSFIESKLLSISYLSALYFSVVSIETIGFGDIYPKSPGARVFTCFYIVGGILNIALGVTIARDVILESAVVNFQQRLAAQKHERRLRSRWRAAIRWRLRARGLPTWIHHHRHGLPEEHPHHQRWYDLPSRVIESFFRFVSRRHEDPAWKYQYGPRQKRLNIEALTEEDWNAAALETGAPVSKLVPEEIRLRWQDSTNRPPLSRRPTLENVQSPHSLTHFRLGGMLAILGNFAIAVSQPVAADSDTPEDTTSNEGSVEEPSAAVDEKGPEEGPPPPRSASGSHGVPLTISSTIYEDDRHSETGEISAKQMLVARLCIAFTLFFAFWLAGSLIFMATERWSFWTAVYFCFISFTTVGYGDITPKTPAGQSIFVFWALLGVATVTILVSVVMENFSDRYRHAISGFETPSASPTSRPPLSEHPTFTSGTELFSPASAYQPRSRREAAVNENVPTPRVRIQENPPDRAVESTSNEGQARSSDSQPSQSVPMQVDHLKSLITMARSQCESESDDGSHLENLISYLEKTLRDV